MLGLRIEVDRSDNTDVGHRRMSSSTVARDSGSTGLARPNAFVVIASI